MYYFDFVIERQTRFLIKYDSDFQLNKEGGDKKHDNWTVWPAPFLKRVIFIVTRSLKLFLQVINFFVNYNEDRTSWFEMKYEHFLYVLCQLGYPSIDC